QPPVSPAAGRPGLPGGGFCPPDRPGQRQRAVLERTDQRQGPGAGTPRRATAGPALPGGTAAGGPAVLLQRGGWPAPEPVAGAAALPGRHERRGTPPERRAAAERAALYRLRLPRRHTAVGR